MHPRSTYQFVEGKSHQGHPSNVGLRFLTPPFKKSPPTRGTVSFFLFGHHRISNSFGRGRSSASRAPWLITFLPTDFATSKLFNSDAFASLFLPQNMSFERINFVRRRSQSHRFDMVRSRVCSHGVHPGLPDAGGKVETGSGIWDTVPVHDETAVHYSFFVS